MAQPDYVVQLRYGKQSCTGFFIDSHTLITAAHFLRDKRGNIAVKVGKTTLHSKDYVKIPRTDIAVVRVQQPQEFEQSPSFASWYPAFGSQAYTIGFGGKKTRRTLRGWYVGRIPFNVNSTLETRIRKAGLVLAVNKAIPGDSGAPVYVGGQVVGIQSLVFNPSWCPLGIATISLLPPYLADVLTAATTSAPLASIAPMLGARRF